ncbi:MAG: hypothetical protein JWM03_568 [Rhodocyclales bacterium]|nr:hypothetical protein [Rhodocyclales bacterium]
MMSTANEQSLHADANAERLYKDSLAVARQGQWQHALTLAEQAVVLQPYNANYHAHTGCTLFMLGEYSRATDSLVRAIDLDANHVAALNNLAYIYNQAACYGRAEALLQHSVSLVPDQAEAWLSLCFAAQHLDYREDDAVRYAMRAVELNPRSAFPYTYLSRAKLTQGDLPGALEAIQIAASLDPDNPAYHYRAGVCLLEMDRVAEAIDAFQAALALDPEHCDTWQALAEYLYKIEDFAAAEEACRHAELRAASKFPVHELLAKILFVTGRYVEAKQLFDENTAAFCATNKITPRRSHTGWAPVRSVANWSESHSLTLIPMLPERTLQTEDALCFGASPEGAHAEPVTLPAAYVAEVANAVIMPGHELILVNGERQVLYDRLAFFRDWHALRPDEYVPMCSDTHVFFQVMEMAPERIEAGIFLLTEAMNNYAHWISEQLPRLRLLEHMPQYDGMPILVSDGLYPQQIEALEFIVQGRYPIRILDLKQSFEVGRLIYPSILTAYHKRRYRPNERASATDGALHPEAIHYLRERILPRVGGVPGKRRRLWISRRKQFRKGQRRLLNEAELEALFLSYGFESVMPENMSFIEQVKLFSEAEMIAGPGGSAFMNMVFAHDDARVLILTKDHPEVNYHYFSNIARIIGQSVAYVCGETVKNHGVLGFETDYTVDLATTRDAIEKFLLAARR